MASLVMADTCWRADKDADDEEDEDGIDSGRWADDDADEGEVDEDATMQCPPSSEH